MYAVLRQKNDTSLDEPAKNLFSTLPPPSPRLSPTVQCLLARAQIPLFNAIFSPFFFFLFLLLFRISSTINNKIVSSLGEISREIFLLTTINNAIEVHTCGERK